jgi:hypothetical protein
MPSRRKIKNIESHKREEIIILKEHSKAIAEKLSSQ